ncbi:MAG: ribosome recycling factor [Planctomycetota bacterium]|jgi:ribosome recycling factor|nr:ribosome recycling factor [Planctomycetota bacterium]
MSSSVATFLDSAKDRMDKSVQHFMDETRGIRTGRASVGLLDSVRVDYYGQRSPLNQIASVTAPDARTLIVKAFDPSSNKEIEKAITAAGLGLNPVVDGTIVRIAIPPLSEDQRKKLASRVKSVGEDAKVALRNVRRDTIKEIETASKDSSHEPKITEDDVKYGKATVQDVLKEFEKKVEDLIDAKSKDIMTI